MSTAVTGLFAIAAVTAFSLPDQARSGFRDWADAPLELMSLVLSPLVLAAMIVTCSTWNWLRSKDPFVQSFFVAVLSLALVLAAAWTWAGSASSNPFCSPGDWFCWSPVELIALATVLLGIPSALVLFLGCRAAIWLADLSASDPRARDGA